MNFVKRTICTMLIVLLAFSSIQVYANNANESPLAAPNVDSFYHTVLESKGFNGTYQTLDLYNENEVIQWRMYFDSSSYLILDISNGEVMEYGFDCIVPFSNFKDEKPYYGGPLCYYIKTEDKYFSINEDKYYTTSPKIKGVILTETSGESVLQNNLNYQTDQVYASAASLIRTVSVSSPLSIQRQAFGNNVNGTCSAVATSIVLTYLNRTRSAWYVPDSTYMSENLIGTTYSSTSYAKAQKLHLLLISCGMGTMSYADGIRNPVNTYKSQHLPNTTVSVDWRLFRSNPTYITNQIDNNIPGMITTTLFTGGYDWHTMAVYGYKYFSDGSYDFLIHTGWYSSVVNSTSGYIMPKIYVPSNYETYMYKFNI